MSGLTRVLDMSVYAWLNVFGECAGICVNMLKSV